MDNSMRGTVQSTYDRLVLGAGARGRRALGTAAAAGQQLGLPGHLRVLLPARDSGWAPDRVTDDIGWDGSSH